MTRQLLTVGHIERSIVDAAVATWQADTVDGPLLPSEPVVLLAGTTAGAAEYMGTLARIDEAGCPLGILPIGSSTAVADVRRLLGNDTLRVDFERVLFRLVTSPEANAIGLPSILARAMYDDAESVANDLERADVLVLQGHAGPIDGGMGRNLILCSRERYSSGPRFFPCFGSNECFRQPSFGRPMTSREGLHDPEKFRVPLIVLDGCNTIPTPGSLFDYETSIARSLIQSRMSAAIMTHGASATPISAFVLFLAMLARGRTLGLTIRDVNRHRRELASPSFVAGTAGTWALIGNPELTITGIPLQAAQPLGDGSFAMQARAESARATGTLLELPGDSVAVDVACRDGRWARGVSYAGRSYVWIAGAGETTFRLDRRGADATRRWRDTAAWLVAGRSWLGGLVAALHEKGGDAESIESLCSLLAELAPPIELAAFAVRDRAASIMPAVATSTTTLARTIDHLDRFAAVTIAAAIPTAGPRLVRLWSPRWIAGGPAAIATSCECGAPIAGIVQCHAYLDVSRIELGCPACGPLGDVVARRTEDGGYLPAFSGGPPSRRVGRGVVRACRIETHEPHDTSGHVAVTLFDATRRRALMAEPVALDARVLDLSLEIPDDWPAGLSHVAVVIVRSLALSFVDFDISVQ